MCGNTTDDPVGVFAQIGEIGKDEIDAQHVEIREHQATVKKKDFPIDFYTRTVTADFTEPAEEGDRYRRSLGIAHGRRLRRRVALFRLRLGFGLRSVSAHAYNRRCTSSARSSRSSGPKPMGGRQGPAGCPIARNIAFVGTGFGLRSPVSNS
ncbi:unannotated protein [freshwater metagenome]|uniref:Unannotated protein n=1 Tax=freshwater metagenome TaxID=449393 RepID=A0A6J7LIT2_9ZZZZ